MSRPTLAARISSSPDGNVRVEAPTVGVWVDPPAPGTWLGPGSVIGEWERLNRRWKLVLPAGVSGVVTGEGRGSRVPLGHGELLLLLAPLNAAETPVTTSSAAAEGLPAGAHAVFAPTDGVFYRSPDPDAPPFVEVGDRLQRGQPIGLIEVMKTFNQILFDGDVPDEAEVLEVRRSSGEEVKAGAVLLVVR